MQACAGAHFSWQDGTAVDTVSTTTSDFIFPSLYLQIHQIPGRPDMLLTELSGCGWLYTWPIHGHQQSLFPRIEPYRMCIRVQKVINS